MRNLYIAYIRVSTEFQEKKGFSIQEQTEACKRKAYDLGAKSDDEIIIFVDSESGEFLNRTQFSLSLELVENEEVSYYICYDPDRFSRKAVNALIAHEMIEKHGTEIVYVNSDYEKTPEGRLFLQMKMIISEYEKAKIKSRTMMGKLGKAKRKLLTHNPNLYGYDYDPITDTLSINEEEKKIILLMINWIFEDKNVGYHTIARRLNNMPNVLPPRGKLVNKKENNGEAYNREEGIWYKGTIKRILNNYTYTGTLFIQTVDTQGVKHNKFRSQDEKVKRTMKPREEWIGITIPEIVPIEIWEQLQSKLIERRNLKPGLAIENYLLRGLLRCNLCSNTLHGNRVKKKNGIDYHKYYVCTAKSPGIKGQPKCTLSAVNAKILEELVWNEVKGWVLNPETLENIITNDKNNELLFKEKKQLEIKIKELNEEKDRLDLLFMKGKIDEIKYDKFENENKNTKIELVTRLKQIELQLNNKNLNLKDFQQLKETLKEYQNDIDNITYEIKQKLINGFIKTITIGDKDDIRMEIRIPKKDWNKVTSLWRDDTTVQTFTIEI